MLGKSCYEVSERAKARNDKSSLQHDDNGGKKKEQKPSQECHLKTDGNCHLIG